MAKEGAAVSAACSATPLYSMGRNILTITAITIPALAMVAAIFVILAQGAQERRAPLTSLDALDNILTNAPARQGGALPFYHEGTDMLLIARTDRYLIVYQRSYNMFVITVLAKSFEDVRKEAEAVLLSISGGDRAALCGLEIKIRASKAVNPALASSGVPFSGC